MLFYLIAKGYTGYIPPFRALENPTSAIASEVISADGKTIGRYFRENRSMVEFSSLSPHLVNALIATEDIRFYRHSGIDLKGVVRAIIKTGILGDPSGGGGSTISQQLAKLLYSPHSKTIWERIKQKLNEWVIAVKLERSYTKNEIISIYLNQFDFNNLAVGIKSASKIYFSTTPDSLTIEQAATLVGMLQNPSLYNPVRRRELTEGRRNIVLRQMNKYGYIKDEVHDSLVNIPLEIKFQRVDHKVGSATYYREFIRTTMTARKPEREQYPSWMEQAFIDDSTQWATNPLYGWCHKNLKPDSTHYDIYSDGLKIYTTIDSRMQQYAEDAVNEHVGKILHPLFLEEKRGRAKGPFANVLTEQQVKQILYNSMTRSERYRVYREAGLSRDSIIKAFNEPVEMRVFSWDGDKDTIMSPMDSIRYYKYFLNAGLMSMDPVTGYVKAYVGGLDYKYFKYDHVTGARRQVGSTFKPFLYTLAVMPGEFSPCKKVPNVPVSFKMPEDQEPPYYTPRFSNPFSHDDYIGKEITLKFGLSWSLNQVSAWIMKKYTPEATIDVARKMGVRSPLEPVFSLCVGAAEVKLCEMVAAYCTYANKGIYTEPVFVSRIEDKNRNIIYQANPKKEEAISDETAYLMVDMMKGVVDIGTSRKLRYKYKFTAEIAGKTGTTDDNSDGWFIGYVPRLATGVWVGGEVRSIRFDKTSIGQGNTLALPIWALYMKEVYNNRELNYSQDETFEVPPQITPEMIDCDSEENTNQEYEKDVDVDDTIQEDLFLDM